MLDKVTQNFVQNLKKIGVTTHVRVVDPSSYEKMMGEQDFDMTMNILPMSMVPGNELRDFWSSTSADIPNTRNISGIKNTIVDDLINHIIGAPCYKDIEISCRALSRVLLWEYSFVPLWYSNGYNVVISKKYHVAHHATEISITQLDF